MRVFDEIFVDKTKYGTKIKTDDYQEYGLYPIIDQGQKQIAGYTDLSEGVFTDVPAIIFGDHTRIIKYVDKPFFIGADGVKILKSNLENANYKYLYYALLNAKIPNTGYNRHFKWLKQLKFSCPDLDRQKSIVNILDKIKIVIDFRTKQLEKYDELIKARFVEMFGDPITNPMRWEKALLSKVIDVVGGYAFKSGDFNEDYGVPVLRIGNINSGYFKPVNMVYWNEDEKLEKYAIYPGDLVVSLTGTVGKNDYGNACIIGDDYNMYYLNQRNAKLSIEGEINKYYLAQLLKYEAIKQKLTGISRGVRQANISNADILNLIVPIPPLAKQNQFADFVKQIDKSKFVELKYYKNRVEKNK